jgi:hypothetical protein
VTKRTGLLVLVSDCERIKRETKQEIAEEMQELASGLIAETVGRGQPFEAFERRWAAEVDRVTEQALERARLKAEQVAIQGH